MSDAGYKVPEDISLAGFDGVEIGKYVIPSLTTLKQPVDSMARETARILFDIIGKKAKHQHCVFDGDWWCGILRCEDLNYADTWLYLGLHFICALRSTDLERLGHPKLTREPLEV